ncbi:MAG: hypothetical protein M1833_006237 [Piccolia ochrophora]|nr:MAG: hypothetical protein M1833_006237 [Piccolia ochrophora]
MPAYTRHLARGIGEASREWEYVASRVQREASQSMSLAKRILIPINDTSPPEMVEASKQDPWIKSDKYALGWVYFCIILLSTAIMLRLYHLWNDKIRTALYKDSIETSTTSSPSTDYEMTSLDTNNTVAKLFPRNEEKPAPPKEQSSLSSMGPVNNGVAMVRWIFYRPIPNLKWRKRTLVFPSLGVTFIVSCATIFVTLYCFVPQPLYYANIAFGSPPLAIRSGMLAVAMMPWIVAMSMKANLVSMLTGIGHERLNVLHRWGGYLCLFLSLIHTIPFYVQPVWNGNAMAAFESYFKGQVVYGTGIAALVPLIWLCVASLPIIRAWMYELFVALHVPVAIIYIGMLFWHCHNYLTSWHYLSATVAIWVCSLFFRLFKLNWANPWRLSWLVGDEAAVSLLSEDAIKVTIPTQTKWKPGQYVYLRMPGISIFENHPFTISSLCSDDFPSEYGEGYRDMTLVFKPFGGFTRKVFNTAIEKGPYKSYRAFIDGPYGGMHRSLEAFDNVVLIAGGSGITAIVSQLLQLVKKMRDGKAVTKNVQVIWAIKRLDALDWFREELRICREFSPPDSVHCQFFVTAAKRQSSNSHSRPSGGLGIFHSEKLTDLAHGRPISGVFGSEKLNDFAQGIASKRNSALIRDEAGGDPEKERELRYENEDAVSALPATHQPPHPPHPLLQHPPRSSSRPQHLGPPSLQDKPLPPMQPLARSHTRSKPSLEIDIPASEPSPPFIPISTYPQSPAATHQPPPPPPPPPPPQPAPAPTESGNFQFGFPSTPTVLQKSLMRFAFGPGVVKQKRDGWSTNYGRPDIPYMLREFSESFGKRSCVFVCGPPGMRTDVAMEVARLQSLVVGDPVREEVFLHTENYAL